eukprot:2975080-Karenia_brevis.AAC.1
MMTMTSDYCTVSHMRGTWRSKLWHDKYSLYAFAKYAAEFGDDYETWSAHKPSVNAKSQSLCVRLGSRTWDTSKT